MRRGDLAWQRAPLSSPDLCQAGPLAGLAGGGGRTCKNGEGS